MKYFILALFAFFAFLPSSTAQPIVQNLRCEQLTNPIGIGVKQPRFSWALQSEERSVVQAAYEITVNAGPNGRNIVWSSGKITSSQSLNIPYEGKTLQAGKRYAWLVRVWDKFGNVSRWSESASFQMAFLNNSDWKAQWIVADQPDESPSRPSPIFRKQFEVKPDIQSATVYITAHGLYEAQINGQRIGKAYLTPGWTSYNKRLPYQVYDVADLLKSGGPNAIGVTLGNGWYRGRLGRVTNRNTYGKDVALLFQLDITYGDGSRETIVSDGSWKSSTGAIRFSEIYDGETIDARLGKNGWAGAGFDDSKWPGVLVKDYPKNTLVTTINEPIKKHETFKPVRVFETPKGEQVLDFGQNLVGWVEVKVKGKAGHKIILSFSETLDLKTGNVYFDNMRSAVCRDTFILKGGGEEVFEPHFTFHGFRYVKVEGWDGKPNADNFTAVALYSDMPQTGSFECSNALVNQLQHNIQWGQKGNFIDVPTDCPQRDERLGWTGDAQVFSRTAAFNMDAHNFFTKWLKDVALDQRGDGAVPFVIPNVLGDSSAASAGWADAATIIPWNLYLAYGDKKVLADQYESMKAWVSYMENNSRNYLWNTGFHFGDWLFYDVDDDRMGRSAITDKYLIAQCFFAHSTQILLDAARILGKSSDELRFTVLLANIKDAFIKEYTTANGRLVSGTQTAYTQALQFDMLPENMRAQAAERLVENVKSYKYHLTTGFLGTPYLNHVLTRFGYTDVAYKLLLQEKYPSWLYPVTMGATTIWERWDGIKPDSTFQTPKMNSFNHYAYGAIGDWLYRAVAGLDTDEKGPGYKDIIVKPHPGGGLSYATASLQTDYGLLRSYWKMEGGKILLELDIPANTTATIYIPTNKADAVTESGTDVSVVPDLKVMGTEKGYLIVQAGSGKYKFAADLQ